MPVGMSGAPGLRDAETMTDPMAITAEHCMRWQERLETLGSSRTRNGQRKTFEISAIGRYVVTVYPRAGAPLILYDGGNEAEAIRLYNEA